MTGFHRTVTAGDTRLTVLKAPITVNGNRLAGVTGSAVTAAEKVDVHHLPAIPVA